MEQLSWFQDYLKQSGMKSTKQRLLIVKAFLATDGHFTADELHHSLRDKIARIGYATVYRTLKILVKSGLANELYFGDGTTRYEACHHKVDNFEQYHYHMICLHCGKVIEFEEPQVNLIQARISGSHDFYVQTPRLELYGLCRHCRTDERVMSKHRMAIAN